MRVADKMSFDQVNRNISKNRSDMSELQNQAATQKRVTKPSDDPIAASRVLSSRIELQGSNQYVKNLNYARGFLEYTDQSLNELGEHLVRAKELAIAQSSDGAANEDSRKVVAAEIEQIYNQMVTIGNRKLGDRFIFGGYKTTKAPFDMKGHYKGDSGEMLVHVDKSSFVAMNLPGDKIFFGAPQKTQTQAETIEELMQQKTQQTEFEKAKADAIAADIRGPSSINPPVPSGVVEEGSTDLGQGVNLFQLMQDLRISLVANDKGAVQNTLDRLDEALSQVVLARATLGARVMVLNNSLETLSKTKVDSQIGISQLEDADVFEVISDINKTEGTLKATMETSGKMIQPSLLDFLR